ncbi:peptidylglycine alpha-hydroxylating monooxygenase-like isoform X1 [Mytilus californianus]|uniref:peptidylglycine alpha-hydroxylating monooxygenase-like isoform X1 n=2 Tax=Mytilus californianus TaxID=6549 RepID=UPI0022467BA0|nr:peptidylglycine alpha-hydroxylating monooxygenase-like isoform X1 [Mytilus californianus]
MPNVVPQKPDSLLCHAVKLDPRETYILRFEPLASKSVAHHMNLFGCDEPGSDLPSWTCGEENEEGHRLPICKHGPPRIIYAWALDGKPRSLPSGTGYRVGGTTGINYLLINLHYKDKLSPGQTDNSGYYLEMTHDKQPLQVGHYILGTVGEIPPMTKEFHADSGCNYDSRETIYPIAYRTHSHNLGVVTSGYRYRDGTYTEIGRMSPQLPQTFYDVAEPNMNITTGDLLISRCTMSSQRKFATNIGPTNRDEMCNFYIMYYTSRQEDIKDERMCFRDHNSFHLKDYLSILPQNISSIVGLPNFERTDPYAV